MRPLFFDLLIIVFGIGQRRMVDCFSTVPWCLAIKEVLGGWHVPQSIINRLLESLEELERSIRLAKKTLSTSEKQDESLCKRISYYEEVISKQKKLSQSLCEHMMKGNWTEVSRHVKLINGFSTLVRQDAKNLILEIIGGTAAEAADPCLS